MSISTQEILDKYQKLIGPEFDAVKKQKLTIIGEPFCAQSTIELLKTSDFAWDELPAIVYENPKIKYSPNRGQALPGAFLEAHVVHLLSQTQQLPAVINPQIKDNFIFQPGSTGSPNLIVRKVEKTENGGHLTFGEYDAVTLDEVKVPSKEGIALNIWEAKLNILRSNSHGFDLISDEATILARPELWPLWFHPLLKVFNTSTISLILVTMTKYPERVAALLEPFVAAGGVPIILTGDARVFREKVYQVWKNSKYTKL